MASIQVSEASAAITVNGTLAGYITVGSSTPFVVGAICNLAKGDGTVQYQVQITDLGAANTIGLRRLADPAPLGSPPWMRAKQVPNYGRTDLSGTGLNILAADNWTLYQLAQIVAVPRTTL